MRNQTNLELFNKMSHQVYFTDSKMIQKRKTLHIQRNIEDAQEVFL